MGVASIPFLVTIISGIGAILRAVWEGIVSVARQSAFIMATIIPMILRWFLTTRAFQLTILVALGLAFVSTFRAAFAVFNHTIQLIPHWNQMLSHFTWMTYILWDGPLNLREMYMRIPDIMGVWASLNVVRFMFTRLSWLQQIANRNFRFS